MECFTENIDFYGNDLKKFKPVPNAKDCQLKCQQTEGCKFWSYKPVEGKDCWLKTNNNFKEDKSNRISGPKYCGKCFYEFLFVEGSDLRSTSNPL